MSVKHFVLDTNVLLHDPCSVFAFEDNNIVISPVVLEELDAIKSQNRTVSPDARQAIRLLESIVEGADPVALGSLGVQRNEEGGKLIIPALKAGLELMEGIKTVNNDQRIIRDALILKTSRGFDTDKGIEVLREQAGSAPGTEPLETIFVSRDLNARLMARAHGLVAEDFKAAQVKSETEEFPSGVLEIERDVLDSCLMGCEHRTYFYDRADLEGSLGVELYPHLMIVIDDFEFFRVIERTDKQIVCLHRNMGEVSAPFDLEPKNIRQACAMDVLMDESIPLVTLTGGAGSGKTLLSLAMGLEKMMAASDPNARPYNKIIVARSSDGLGDDIGALPGTEEEKVKPWLGAIQDNLEVLLSDADPGMGSLEYAERYIQYKSINFMRGRSFQNTLIILDEGQNLTPSQMKTLVTRVGQGSKMVVLGDLTQIDNPYLSPYSSGLTHVVENFKDSRIAAHVKLVGSPRSPIAEEGAERL